MRSSAISPLALASLLASAAACGGHSLDAGNQPDGGDAAPPPLPAGSCSSLTWGATETPSSSDECNTLFLGRWTLCADDAGPIEDDSGFPYVLPQPAGVEFTNEGGGLSFYILVPGAGGLLVRSQDPSERGAVVDPLVTGNACRAWMSPDSTPGDQTGWTLQRYQKPDALLINGAASYVPAR
jgi:hypothetical protein